MIKTFISYSSKDAKIIDGIVNMLRSAGGIVFRDKDSIKPGQDWKAAIDKALINTDQVMVFWCCHSNQSEMIRYELTKAIELKKRVIPVLCCSYEVDPLIRDFQWINMNDQFSHDCVSQEQHSAYTPNRKNRLKRRISLAIRLFVFAVIAILLLLKPIPPSSGSLWADITNYTLIMTDVFLWAWIAFDLFRSRIYFHSNFKASDDSDLQIRPSPKSLIKAKIADALEKVQQDPFYFYPSKP